MNILLLGSGGREHALAWKIAQSPLCHELFIAPGNAGTLHCGTNADIDISDFKAIADFSLKHKIEFVIPGPEAPLVAGIYNYFKSNPALSHIGILGPSKTGALLEGSKQFAKQFMIRHNIPTARYLSVTSKNLQDGFDFIRHLKAPYVLKADGLAAGKGVIIEMNQNQACKTLEEMLGGMFGDASKCVVIEEFLTGIELSVFFITDGSKYLILPEAKDYKRIGEGDSGLNTGGMGSVSPVPFADKTFLKKVKDRIIVPTVAGLMSENLDYKGFVFLGLMNVSGDPYVIEYNVRLGDPETESVVPRIKNDFFDIIVAAANGDLSGKEIVTDSRFVASVMLVSKGYPEAYEKEKEIAGLKQVKNSLVFHAGTKMKNQSVVSNGGRVMAVSAFGKTMDEALHTAYNDAEIIEFDNKYYRSDIGFDIK